MTLRSLAFPFRVNEHLRSQDLYTGNFSAAQRRRDTNGLRLAYSDQTPVLRMFESCKCTVNRCSSAVSSNCLTVELSGVQVAISIFACSFFSSSTSRWVSAIRQNDPFQAKEGPQRSSNPSRRSSQKTHEQGVDPPSSTRVRATQQLSRIPVSIRWVSGTPQQGHLA